MKYSRNIVAYLAIMSASIIGSFSLLLYGFFLFGISFTVVELGFGVTGVLAWNALLCVLFFVQHSTMVRKTFRSRLAAIIPEPFHGALYTVASGTVLICLVLFWQNSELMVVSLQGIGRWVAYSVFFASLMGMVWGMRALHSFDMFGNQQILASIHASQIRNIPLTIRGPYRWVRHPLYFFTLLLIWCCPDVTVDRLLMNVLFTAWIVVGTLLEERDLVAEFRQPYQNYQRQVPMLIPWKLPMPSTIN